MSFSATMAGWRTIWRAPVLVLGEIAWRWTLGLIGILIVAFALAVYLSAVQVPAAALWLIGTGQPALVGAGLAYAIRDTGWLAVKISLLALPPVGVLWIFLASLGRAATLRPMLGCATDEDARPQQGHWLRLYGVMFLRLSLWFAVSVASAGALMVALAGDGASSPVPPLLMFFLLEGAILSLGALPNWLLCLATIFVVRDGRDTFQSISSGLDLLHKRFPALLAASSAWAALRAISLAVLLGLGGLPASAHLSRGAAIMAGLLIALAYLAFGDLVSVGRLGSYVAILEDDHETPAALPPTAPKPLPGPDFQQFVPEFRS